MEITFTERELDIMGILWDQGPSTVAEVRNALADELAYTTVLTMLRILESKGYVGREEEGRAHRYHTLVDRSDAGEHAIKRMVRKLYKGSAAALLTQLVSDRGLTEEELRRIRALLDRHIDDQGGE